MSGTITPDLTTISLCEADDWDGGVGAVDGDSQVQGTYCLTITYTGAGLRAVNMKTISSSVLTNKNIYGWITVARLAMLESTANGGIRFRVEDGTYFAEWYVGGNDSPTSGWFPYTCNCGVHPDRHGTAPETDDANEPNYGAITKVGFRVNLAIKGIVKWDAFRFGTGLSVKAGTSGDPATFTNIYDEDNNATYKYGVLTRSDGIYYLQGQLNIGSTTGGDATYFKDTSKVVVFPDRKVGTFYQIKIQGNGTATTKVFLGEKVGTAGISGCTLYVAGTPKFKFIATDTNITELGIYGSTFYGADTISLPTYSTVKEVLNTTFEKCAEVLADTCIVRNCNFISSAGRAIRISSASHNVTNSNFINCQTAVHHDVGGPSGTPLEYDYDKLMFTGGTYHIENSASTPNYYINIDRLNGSNPDEAKINNSNGGTTVILPIAVLLKVYVEDKDGNKIQNAQTAIFKQSDMTQLMNEDTDVNGLAQESFNHTVDTPIYIRVRKSSTGATKYIPYSTSGTITSAGYTLTVVLSQDSIA